MIFAAMVKKEKNNCWMNMKEMCLIRSKYKKYTAEKIPDDFWLAICKNGSNLDIVAQETLKLSRCGCFTVTKKESCENQLQ